MANTIDKDGFSRTRFQDLRVEKAQEYRDGFSNQELKTDVQSGVGQEVSISTFAEDDLASRFETLLSVFDPTAAQGVHQDRLAIVMNKRRQDATPSTVTMTLTADASGATIPLGSQIANVNGDVVFSTTSELVLAPSGSDTVEAQSTTDGAVEAVAASLTVIKTPVFGWLSATNILDASIGRTRESDGELRIRMLASSSANSSTVIGIYTALSNVDGVTALSVLENNTLVSDAIGVPAKSIFPIVEGGADSDIARALIAGGVAGGIGYTDITDIPTATFVSATYDDPITLQTYTATWARPSDIQIYVEVNLNKLATYPADGDTRVKAAIEDWVLANMEFGEDLFASQLYTPVQEIEGAIVVSVFVGLAPSPAGSTIAIDVFERASVVIADVDIP